jgi:uncharacterized protein YrzB (UPF0473 family)
MSEHNHEHGADCGCGDEELAFSYVDEQGVEHEMILIETFETAGQNYAVLIEKNDPEAEGVIVRIEEQGDELALSSIDDDAEWQSVIAAYEKLVAEQG